MNKGSEIIKDLLTKFPTASTRAVARMAYDESPASWKDYESCRYMVRTYCGSAGKKARADMKPDFFRTLPAGKVQLKSWEPFRIEGKSRSLILCDLHIPYHDKAPLLTALKAGDGADVVILNGDVSDFFSISRWETDPRQRNFKDEIETVILFLSLLRGKFRKARIIYKAGNHEERYISYMRHKAPELLGIDDFELESILKLRDFGIELVDDKRPIALGDLNVIHGHEYKFAISNPVNSARGLFLRACDYALCGHFHQSSYHTKKAIRQNVIATWSIGCLCDLHPEYLPLNDWVHGFAIVEVDARGKFNVEHRVIRGERFIDMTTQELLKFHEEFCARGREIMAAKNHDYAGASGQTPFANFESTEHLGICTTEQGFLVRIGDKIKRLVTFCHAGVLKVKSESAEDACLDILNYVVLLAAWFRHKRESQPKP